MTPTQSAFTRMFHGASSCDITLVSVRPAERLSGVGALSPFGALALALTTLMIRPPRRAFMAGLTSLARRPAATTFGSRYAIRSSRPRGRKRAWEGTGGAVLG